MFIMIMMKNDNKKSSLTSFQHPQDFTLNKTIIDMFQRLVYNFCFSLFCRNHIFVAIIFDSKVESAQFLSRNSWSFIGHLGFKIWVQDWLQSILCLNLWHPMFFMTNWADNLDTSVTSNSILEHHGTNRTEHGRFSKIYHFEENRNLSITL